MSSQYHTVYCFRCQYQPEPDEPQLKQCSGCHLRRYCSQQCQRNDWKDHKTECRILAAGGGPPPRVRSTMRINMGAFLQNTAEEQSPENPDTIYYLKTSKPHIHDISISGPYYPFEMIFGQLLYRLRTENSVAGERTLDDLVRDGVIASIEHFTAPLPDGNIMRFHLLRERNPMVARHLPGEVWRIVVATPLLDSGGIAVVLSNGSPQLENMNIHATSITRTEANRAAGKLLDELKEQAGAGARVSKKEIDGLVHGLIIPRTNSQFKAKIVQVSRDDGQIRWVRPDQLGEV